MSINRIQRQRRWNQSDTVVKTVKGEDVKSLLAKYTLQGYKVVNVLVADSGAACTTEVLPDVAYVVTLKKIGKTPFDAFI